MTETTETQYTHEELPTLNVSVIQDLMEWIQRSAQLPGVPIQIDALVDSESGNPVERLWSQITWHCNTSCCIAGAVVLLADAQPIRMDAFGYTAIVRDSSGVEQVIDLYAEKKLGITHYESNLLFYAEEDPAVIRDLFLEFARKRGQELTIPELV